MENKQTVPQHILNVARALRFLGVSSDSKFSVTKCADSIYKVKVNKQEFGLFDNSRQTFVE